MNEKLKAKIEEVISKDRDSSAIYQSMEFISSEFKNAFKIMNYEDKYDNMKREEKIKILVLLGLGRDKTAFVLKDLNVNREDIKEIKESMNDIQNEFRINNEKKLTQFKIDSTSRVKRAKELKEAGVDFEEILDRYKKEEPLHKIASDTGVSSHVIKQELKQRGVYDETKSTLLKRDKAEELFDTIDDNFIRELVTTNPLDSKDLWWKKSKKKYPWILRRQFFKKLKDLGLERSREEENELRRIKSLSFMQKNVYSKENNSPQLIKMNTTKKIEKEFGSLATLVELYKKSRLGSFHKIADTINKNEKEGLAVSARQIEKAITGHENYVSQKSYPQKQLLEFIKESFPEFKITEEYVIPGTNMRIDMIIEDLAVGIEFNGDYWHSDDVIKKIYKKDSSLFHKERAENAKLSKIKLCYVWEKDWTLNYKEVEREILRRNWDSKILNKYDNKSYFRNTHSD